MVDEDLSIYINDYLGGESLNSLEKRTGISSGKLKRFFIKEGIEIRQCHKMNDELAHEIFDLYESGLTLKEVAKKLDLNVLTVSKTMDKYGVSRRSNSEYKREPVETISYFDTISKEELDTYIQAYLNGEGIHSMWKRTGKSKYSIRNMLVKNGIDIRQRKVIPKDLEPTFVELYKSGVSSCEIGRRYNVVHGSVCKILERHGIERRDDYEKKREYPIDHTFFDSIHDEKTAYFFGLLFADGTINDTHNIIKIGLIEEDKGVLEILTSYIQPTKPMVVYDYAKMRNNPKLKFQYAMTIHSIYIGENLVSYSMIPRKTKIKVFPEVVLNSS